MNKEKLIKAVKIIIITFLVLMISLLVMMKWKSDVIMDKVMAAMQDQLIDSLQYTEAGMDWFSYFPSTSIHISDLKLGSGATPLIANGSVDVVISLFPLLKGNIIINTLKIENSTIHIAQKNGHWSYDVMKKSDADDEGSFKTEVQRLVFENCTIAYDDGDAFKFNLAISEGVFKGGMEDEKLEMDIDMNSSLSDLAMDGYTQPEAFPSLLTGQYTFDLKSGLQEYKDWRIETDAIALSAQGTILRASDHEAIDMDLTWEKANPELLKKWLPEKLLKTWNEYALSGESEGEAKIDGRSSSDESPHIAATATLKNGGVVFAKNNEEIKGLTIDLKYDSGNAKTKQKSSLAIALKKSAIFGSSLEGQVDIQNLDNPVYDVSLNGSLPASLINLASVSGLHFEKGSFDIDHFELKDFRPESSSMSSFLQHGTITFKASDLIFSYQENKMALPDGTLDLSDGKLNVDLDQFTWNKATVDDLKGSIVSHDNQLDFTLDGKLCEGQVETKGTVSGLNQRPVSNATWKVTGIEMKQLLESFSNFDQTFITSDNLKGKANIWAESTIPFDDHWNMITEKVMVKSALDIRDGQLKDMKTLEDFGTYVHLDDLRDIRFNQLRNYMKIENGTVYLPVMFIQSSALNMSISGEHTFDQKILYYLKLNAGQVAATKLKKNDVKRDFKKASKSGWINMYFVLNGTTSNVKYQQERSYVISGFESSTALKEGLRNYLVEKFGYDVYWIEPNEWEDIPEYQ